jgi:hypothetical protein
MFTVWSEEEDARSERVGCRDKCQQRSTWAESFVSCTISAGSGDTIVEEVLLGWKFKPKTD